MECSENAFSYRQRLKRFFLSASFLFLTLPSFQWKFCICMSNNWLCLYIIMWLYIIPIKALTSPSKNRSHSRCLLDATFAHRILGCLCVLMRVHGCICVCAHVCVRVSIKVWLSVHLLRIVQIWRIVFRHSQCMLTKQRTHPRGSIVNTWTQICSSPSRYVSANNSWVIRTPRGL